AADLECDVAEPDLPALRPLRGFGRGMLADGERVKVLAQCHKHAAMLRVFFSDHKAEHIAVEPLRDLLVGDPQIDVADAFQFDHGVLSGLSPLYVTEVMPAMRTPQGRPARITGAGLAIAIYIKLPNSYLIF